MFRKNINLNKIIKRKFNSNTNNYIENTKHKIKEFDKYRINNYPRIPVFKISMGCGLFSLFSFGTYIIFKNPIDKYISNYGSEIAGNIVGSDDVKISVNNLIDNPTPFGTC